MPSEARTRANAPSPFRHPRRLAGAAALAVAAGCAGDARDVAESNPVAVPTHVEARPVAQEWDQELAPGLQSNEFLDEDAETPAGAAVGAPPPASEGKPRPPDLAVVPIRVVDDVTGEPVVGARIDNWWEADTPHAEPWEDRHEGSWTTDRDGRALVPARERANWYYVEAPGYAPMAEMALEDEYRLVRGADFTIEVRDWKGNPSAGAVLDFVLGCGHTPSARVETAGPDGRLILRCVDDRRGDLWLRADGIAGRNDGYGGWDDLPDVDGVRVLRGDPGPVLEGLVLRADGTPAAGARVGTREAHRGPWTVAGPDGRYRLVGAQPREDLIAMAPYADAVSEGFESPQVEFLSVPGVFATVRLPSEGRPWPTRAEDEARRAQRRAEREAFERGEEPEPTVPPEGPGIRVRIAATPGTTPSGRVGTLFVRDGDGAAQVTSPMFRDGAAARAVATRPGTWTVTAGDASGMLRPQSQRIDVTAGWSDVSFILQPNPVWKPRVLERSADGTQRDLTDASVTNLRVISESGNVRATPHLDGSGREDGFIHVPATGPFAVEYRADDGRRARVLLDRPPGEAGPALLLPPPSAEEPSLDESTRPREFPRARLQVLLPDGRPAAGLRVTIRTASLPSAGVPRTRRGESWDVVLDDDGAATCAFDRGNRVEAVARGEDGEDVLPLDARIDGPGPWTLRWPSGTVEVRATDEAGVPLSEFAVGWIGWDTLDPVEGVVRLRGVGSEPLRLWVAAPGRRMHDLRLVLAPGEKRAVTVRMSRADAE